MPVKNYMWDEPKIIIIKPVPYPVWLDKDYLDRDSRRDVNDFIDKVIKNYNCFFARIMNTILPTDAAFFWENEELSPTGHQVFWSCIDKLIKDFDIGTNVSKFGRNSGNSNQFRRRGMFNNSGRRRQSNTNYHYIDKLPMIQHC